MSIPRLSKCGRFIVIESLHIDRNVFEVLARWARERGLAVQDAVQLAVCAFNERNAAEMARPVVIRVHDSCSPNDPPDAFSYRPDPGMGGPAPNRLSSHCAAHESERTPPPSPAP